jgi:hypothetical protein
MSSMVEEGWMGSAGRDKAWRQVGGSGARVIIEISPECCGGLDQYPA